MSGEPFADAIVVAAGSSTRMGGIDKLDHEVAGRPLLAHAIEAIAAAPEVRRIVVVTAPDRVNRVRAATWLPAAVVSVVGGGGRRQESVAAGFAELERLDSQADDGSAAAGDLARPTGPSDPVILVHDGARPLVEPELVGRIARAAAEHGAAIPVLPLAETLKRLDGDVVAATIERDALATAQTPQGLRRSIFRAALERYPADGPEAWTDEAALLEACRIAVHAIPGDPSNLKVTLPGDLTRVDAVIAARGGRGATFRSASPEPATAASPAIAGVRVGIGRDSHPFGPGSPLALGGIAIEGAPRLSGHSDGDVALHAIADGILGAAGLGDLGRVFPATSATPEGIASAELLREVARRAAGAGLAVSNLDITVVGARPRLADLLDAMRDRIADLLQIEPSAVSVKASTGNLAGMEGAGRGISAQAVVILASSR
ncbi:MAG TPA: 2-C-methyl-D-erythritol 2,4-cyclodiphosphate synthase [Candidatus Limnocylindrales bacterium]|nr:2-C-methyl-D-erythritol 2,4-cyclodiphosphate synthase [Candidatus Limnocylindrales bacterium]